MELKPGKPEDVGMSSSRLKDLAALSQTWIRPDLHQAVVMLAARKGRIVLQEGIGRLTPARDAPPVALDTIYPLSSLSKVFTATAVMILVERGLLGLNDMVSDFFPEFTGGQKENVRVWNLLTHTVGGYGLEETNGYIAKKKTARKTVPPAPDGRHPLIHEFLSLGYDMPLSHQPGTEVFYSNYAFELLGEIVRMVSGQPLGAFAEENIFIPMGMTDTGFSLPKAQSGRRVRRPGTAPWAASDLWFFAGIDADDFHDVPWAAGASCGTALDLAKFGQMFLNRGEYGDARILSPATVALMTRNHTPGFRDRDRGAHALDASRGLGWDIPGGKRSLMYASLYSPRTFSHSGAGGVLLWVDPDYEIVGVCLTVELTAREDGQRTWAADRFANAVTAAVTKV